MYDLKIVNARIVDGTGRPAYSGDIGVKDGQVVALGSAPGDSVVAEDAAGHVVAPGFVDIHTHYDAQIVWDQNLTVSPWHGVTTVVMGNCGFGVAPTHARDRTRALQILEKVEGMDIAALESGLGDWGFETFPAYLDLIESAEPSVNVAAMIAHNPVRLSVLGSESTEREATDDEIREMTRIVQDGLEAGAVGLSTSRSPVHIGYQGLPVPSRLASMDEVVQLARGARGKANIIQIARGLTSDGELELLADEADANLTWTALLANDSSSGGWRSRLQNAAERQSAGARVYPQITCRPLVVEFDMTSPSVFESARMMERASTAPDAAARLAIYSEPEFRAGFKGFFDSRRAPALIDCWERTAVSQFAPDRSIEERVIADLARERDTHPALLVLDLAVESQLEVRFRMAVLNWDENEVEELVSSAHTLLGLSDAGAHASQLCDAGFSTHLLGRWARERQALTLEDAVRRLTSHPADMFGLRDRGRLQVGRPADIVVFDPETIGCSPLRRVADQPANSERFVADAIGMDLVIVNGTVIRRSNQDALGVGARRPGRLLRGGSA